MNLEIIRRRLVARRDALAAVTKRTKSAIRQSPGEVMDYMDSSVRDAGDSVAAQQIQLLSKEYQDVLEAIDRLDKRQYGMCNDCEQPIGETRLRAIPTTELCIRCADQREEDRNPYVRPAISA